MQKIFYMLLLKKDITKKEQIDKNKIKLDASKYNSKKYKFKEISDIIICIKESKLEYLSKFYYLIF